MYSGASEHHTTFLHSVSERDSTRQGAPLGSRESSCNCAIVPPSSASTEPTCKILAF